MKRIKNQPKTKRLVKSQTRKHQEPPKVPFIAHVRELRKRVFLIALAVGAGAGFAFSIQEVLTTFLLRPAGNQQFIYTTPGGGFDFQFKLCLYTGVAVSIPFIIYHIFRYIHPLLGQQTRRFMGWVTFASSVLALTGIAFGYFVGLPAAMHFLLQSLSSERIEALITIQSYMSFVTVYLLGAALLFQIPLILLLINRIKPLNPKTLIQNQRWPILGAVVAGAVISPTPDIQNQLLLSGPIIFMYEASVALIWLRNRKPRRSKKTLELLRKDAEVQAKRLAHAASTQIQQPRPQSMPRPLSVPHTPPPASSAGITAQPTRSSGAPRRYVQDFTRRPYAPLPRPHASDARPA